MIDIIRMHGEGRILMPNKVIYEGDFVYDEMSGSGKFLYPDGSSYIGEVVKGDY
jgi:hypothetical protein